MGGGGQRLSDKEGPGRRGSWGGGWGQPAGVGDRGHQLAGGLAGRRAGSDNGRGTWSEPSPPPTPGPLPYPGQLPRAPSPILGKACGEQDSLGGVWRMLGRSILSDLEEA